MRRWQICGCLTRDPLRWALMSSHGNLTNRCNLNLIFLWKSLLLIMLAACLWSQREYLRHGNYELLRHSQMQISYANELHCANSLINILFRRNER